MKNHNCATGILDENSLVEKLQAQICKKSFLQYGTLESCERWRQIYAPPTHFRLKPEVFSPIEGQF